VLRTSCGSGATTADPRPYREILPLRTRNARSVAYLVDGVDADHRATDVLAG
jgi:hypothetical protein